MIEFQPQPRPDMSAAETSLAVSPQKQRWKTPVCRPVLLLADTKFSTGPAADGMTGQDPS